MFTTLAGWTTLSKGNRDLFLPGIAENFFLVFQKFGGAGINLIRKEVVLLSKLRQDGLSVYSGEDFSLLVIKVILAC